MTCEKCGSENVNVQMVSETSIKPKSKGFLWWLFIGFWWVPLKWLVFTVPALIIKIFKPKKYKTKTESYTSAVCQNCGYAWKV